MLPHSWPPPYCTTHLSGQLWQLQSSKAPLGCVSDISHSTAFQNPSLKLLCPGDLVGKVIPSLHLKMYSSHSLFYTKTSSLISVTPIPALYKVWCVQVRLCRGKGWTQLSVPTQGPERRSKRTQHIPPDAEHLDSPICSPWTSLRPPSPAL